MDDVRKTSFAARIAPLGRRLLGRHARLLRATGYSMGHAVAERHEPPAPARAARRLAPVRVRLVSRSGAPARAPALSAEPAWQPSTTDSTVLPGVSDWAAEYLFGDADSAVSTGDAWLGGAGLTPRTTEERRVSRAKRGAADVARETKILEGDERPPVPPGPKRLARARPTPADAPESSPPAAHDPSPPPIDDPSPAPPARPTIARAARPTEPSPPTAHDSSPPSGHESSPAAVARESSSPPAVARESSPPAEAHGPSPAVPARPMVARVARPVERSPAVAPRESSSPAAVARESSPPAAADESSSPAVPAPPMVARVERSPVAVARESSSPAAAAAAARESLSPGAPDESSSPDAAAVAQESSLPEVSSPGVGVVRAVVVRGRPAAVRVRRVARAEVPVVAPVATPRAGLMRRVVDGLRGRTAAAPPPPSPPAARISRVPRPRVELQDSPVEPAVSETPAVMGTNPVRLARALGTEVGVDEHGNATVEPFVPFSTAPRTVSRAEAPPTSEPHSPAATTPPSAASSAAQPAKVDVDALADTVIEKLRRELLTERERTGAPMDLI